MAGIVTVWPGSSPPSVIGAPATLFTTTTATAPAAWAFCAFRRNPQPVGPRSTTAIAPAGNPMSGPQPCEGAAAGLAGSGPFTTAKLPAMPASGAIVPQLAPLATYVPAAGDGALTVTTFGSGGTGSPEGSKRTKCAPAGFASGISTISRPAHGTPVVELL